MKVIFHKNFNKKYKKLKQAEKSKLKKVFCIFLADSFYPSLNNHALTGKYDGYRSINLGGDLRVIYKMLDEEVCLFVTIGSHSDLYK